MAGRTAHRRRTDPELGPFRGLKDLSQADQSEAEGLVDDKRGHPMEGNDDDGGFKYLGWHRSTFSGAFLFNVASFILPALYATLSKLWVADIDSSMVVTTDVFTYVNTVAEVMNEGLPRASWLIIGDSVSRTRRERRDLTFTLIWFQAALGLVMSVCFLVGAKSFAEGFVPESVRDASLVYVRISAFSCLSGAVETAVGSATRALDKPDVPLLTSSVKFAVNILLDFLIISKFHVGSHTPTVNTQAAIQLVCNMTSAFAGLLYFVWTNNDKNASKPTGHTAALDFVQGSYAEKEPRFSRYQSVVDDADLIHQSQWSRLKVLLKPGALTFTESAIRNGLYLWQVHNMIALGPTYATAWGIFMTIRWGLVMVPVQALEATALAFTGHNWAIWRRSRRMTEQVEVVEIVRRTPYRELFGIIRPALLSVAIGLVVEIPMAIVLGHCGTEQFAKYLSASDEVAHVTAFMWRDIDWCYVFYAVSTPLASILLATSPKWYLVQSLISNLLYVLPWTIVCAAKHLGTANAWTYYKFIFGGSLVFSFADILIVDLIWLYRMRRNGNRDVLKSSRSASAWSVR